ncbi:hypothetical protein K1W69_24470 [Hoeflea sp. WL0058]|uniref:Lipoprotein n=1 Tax=Flavimaribacter sediminis TaxID=2865987 RepID=A0AAE2ZP04_9HYPH|nr:hypothetical protein [Flavimaribacter sediminis]MBW8640369.1 hypothetical protein [Flavimaribacter sediminis]
MRFLIFLAIAGALSACTSGTVIETLDKVDPADYLNGAVTEYYLPEGRIKLAVKYTDEAEKKKASIEISKFEMEIVPDPATLYRLVYKQKYNFSDKIDIKLTSNRLLEKVSTTDDDQTVPIIKNLVSILEQYSNVQKAIDQKNEERRDQITSLVEGGEKEGNKTKKPGKCGDFSFNLYYKINKTTFNENNKKGSAVELINVDPFKLKPTNQEGFSKFDGFEYYLGEPNNCNIKYQVRILKRNTKFNYKHKEYSANSNITNDLDSVKLSLQSANVNNCKTAVCFKIPEEYIITVLLKASKTKTQDSKFSGSYHGFSQVSSQPEAGKEPRTPDKKTCSGLPTGHIIFRKTATIKIKGAIEEDVPIDLCATKSIVTGKLSGNGWERRIQGELKQTSIGAWDSELIFVKAEAQKVEEQKVEEQKAEEQKGEKQEKSIKSLNGSLSFNSTGETIVKVDGSIAAVSDDEEVANAKTVASVWAPSDQALGVLFFWRKQFVANSTTASFQNGMLTGLTIDNPSQISAFLTLPIELLKAVPIIIALN